MPKRSFVNGLLLACLLFPSPFLRAEEKGVQIRPTNRNYYMSTLLGESEHYAPTFYDDYLITLDGKDLGHFTRVDGEPADFYWYVTRPEEMAEAQRALRADSSLPPQILQAFQAYQKTSPSYTAEGLYGQILQTVKNITSVAPQRVLGDEKVTKEVNEVLYQYLRSNGVSDLRALGKNPRLLNMTVNKFYLLSTTYFYRDFPHVKAYLDHLEPVKARLRQENRPFKAKVFACSTGEEVVSYAIELLEAGITDFTILGSDINEQGLRQAREFRYASAMIERLPLDTQQKIKKYFRLNQALGVWEPKDLEFFKSRIRYIRQDLLQELPGDLEARFAPPYDLVSIMNVLFYLDDPAVQARKDYWARITAPDGFLILHDFYYSLLAGTMGNEWAFKNFLTLNDWVSIRMAPGMTNAKKVAFYEAAYARAPSESTLLSLAKAYSMAGSPQKTKHLCETYLSGHPRSMAALRSLWEVQSIAEPSKAAATLDRMLLIQPNAPDVLDRLIASEKGRKEKEFLTALRRSQSSFFAHFKNDPRGAAVMLDIPGAPGEKWETIRRLLKVYAFGVLQNHLITLKQGAEADRLGGEGLRLAADILAVAPASYSLAGSLDQIVQDMLDRLMESGAEERVLQVSDEVGRNFAPVLRWEGFSPRALSAHLALYRAMALKKMNRLKEAREAVGTAVDQFDAALSMMDELLASRYFFFYGDAGRAYFVRSEILAALGDQAGARADESRALELFERGLSYNPLYGKSLYNLRADLLRKRRTSAAGKERDAPLNGTVLRFADTYGSNTYSSEVVRYKSSDGASVEATLLIPDKISSHPGLVFVHMWARDRGTWWGLPEFMASHGYPSIYMDLRGHGGSRFPGADHRVTIRDDVKWQTRYPEFLRDILPAVEMLKSHPGVPSGKVVIFGASLGAPLGVLAADKFRDDVTGMVMMSPAFNYFGVDCEEALGRMGEASLLVTAEKTDASFKGAKEFFNYFNGYKTFLAMDHVGHGTDALYRDVGLPTLILSWLEQLQTITPPLKKIRDSHPLAAP